MIKRFIETQIDLFTPGIVHVIYGPRRSGKTTFVKHFLADKAKSLYVVGDDIMIQSLLGSKDLKKIQDWSSGYEYIVIDEAQYIPEVGYGLKILVDSNPECIIIATGSSSFDLSQKIGEPLTGRKRTYTMFPLSASELITIYANRFAFAQDKEQYLVYGSYPALSAYTTLEAKRDYVHELIGSYLLKDILALEHIKFSKTLFDLVKLLAFQIGNEVSLNELANNLGISHITVKKYIDLLVKSFVIVELSPYKDNRRKSISKMSKYFFLDLGVRNAVINNFNDLSTRDDCGALRENYCIVELMKKNIHLRTHQNFYFYRGYQSGEVDLLIEEGNERRGFDCKRNAQKKPSLPKDLTTLLTRVDALHPDNYLDYLL